MHAKMEWQAAGGDSEDEDADEDDEAPNDESSDDEIDHLFRKLAGTAEEAEIGVGRCCRHVCRHVCRYV